MTRSYPLAIPAEFIDVVNSSSKDKTAYESFEIAPSSWSRSRAIWSSLYDGLIEILKLSKI